MGAWTLPYHLAYATRVSGWCDIYIRRNVDLSDTGSPDMVDSCAFVEGKVGVPTPGSCAKFSFLACFTYLIRAVTRFDEPRQIMRCGLIVNSGLMVIFPYF
jgi:hypothetical protein